jgi:hypothetical protein
MLNPARNSPAPAIYALGQLYLAKGQPRGERPFHMFACGGKVAALTGELNQVVE